MEVSTLPIQTELALISEVLNAAAARYIQSGKNRQVLHVFRDGDWTSLQNRNAVTTSRVLGEQMLRADGAEESPDDDHIEGARVRGCSQNLCGPLLRQDRSLKNHP